MTSDEEISHLYEVVTHEEGNIERALDLIEHERLDAEALNHVRGYEVMTDPNSRINVNHDEKYKCLDREVTLSVGGGGYRYRRPSYAVSCGSVALMMSVAEAREMADKLLNAIQKAEEEAS